MKILVTGSAGFIGHHVSKKLLADDHTVVGIDNLNDYYPPQVKDARNDLLKNHPNHTFINHDIVNRDETIDLIKNGSFDAVCHLAAQAGVRYSLIDPTAYTDTNVTGFIHILEGCRHAPKPPRLVYASSSSVYGGLTELPFRETQRVDTPISLYAATKKANELMAHTYSHLYGLQTIGLRFFTVYGPCCRPDMMLWIFAEAITDERPIKIFNNGMMTRSFSYIDDIVEGVVASITSPNLQNYEIFNLGNDSCDTLTEVISELEVQLNKEAIKDFQPMQAGDVPATWADITRARNHLGLKPESTPMPENVRAFVEWFTSHDEIVDIVRRWRRNQAGQR